jgi:hypothetical protein
MPALSQQHELRNTSTITCHKKIQVASPAFGIFLLADRVTIVILVNPPGGIGRHAAPIYDVHKLALLHQYSNMSLETLEAKVK